MDHISVKTSESFCLHIVHGVFCNCTYKDGHILETASYIGGSVFPFRRKRTEYAISIVEMENAIYISLYFNTVS